MIKVILGSVTLLAVTFLLWPVQESSNWDIRVDQQALSFKHEYLQSIRENPPETRPNVIFILADDLGKYDVSLYNPQAIATPNIDRLGQQGIKFNNAYATAPICAPSRAALLTGRVQNRYGFESQPMQRYIRNNLEYLGFKYLIDTDEMQPVRYDSYPDKSNMLKQGLPPSELTLAELFEASGYRTAILGKWHLGYGQDNHPQKMGFDIQYGFIEAFSLYGEEENLVNFHHDLFWEKHIWDQQRSGPSAITRNGVVVSEDRYLTDAILAETKLFISDSIKEEKPFFAFVPFNAPHTPFQARRQDYDALSHIKDENKRIYFAMIRRLDWAVGELMAHLENNHLTKNTLVIFASDNGAAVYTGATDNGPLRGGKFSQFNGGLAIPMMAYWPGQIPAMKVDAPVLLTDWFATLTGLLGLTPPVDRTYDSTDLFSDKVEQLAESRPMIWRSDYNRAIQFKQWKLLHNKKEARIHLYDLSKDIGESTNVASAYPKQVKKLMQIMDDWEIEMIPPKWPRVMDYALDSQGETLLFAI